MNITVLEELRAYIDPLTPDEHDALERSLLAEGCRDALVLWGDILVDGHNRHAICTRHGIPFQTMQHPHFKSMDDVHLWMINQHLGRRSVSDFQRGVLALRKKEIIEARHQALAAQVAAKASPQETAPEQASPTVADDAPPWATPEPLRSREDIAKAAGISANTVLQIEKIQKTAAPELVAAVKSGEVSINAAAAVASLPMEAQVAAVAGGRKQLKEAARQVREAKAAQRSPRVADDDLKAQAETLAHDQEALLRELTEPRANESPEAFIARLQHTIRELWAEARGARP